MNYFLTCFRLVCLFCCFMAHVFSENRFVIVIPSYNNAHNYEQNLRSVFAQTYQGYRVIYVDDASLDGTGSLVKNFVKGQGQEDRFTLVQNKKRIGALANLYQAVWMCDSDEIVVNLDGDDWFAHNQVMTALNDAYTDPNVWLTYGQFIYYPSNRIGFAEAVPQHIIEQNAFRSCHQGTTALRSFYAGLFHQIKREDLGENGGFFDAAWDLAMMFPMLEMAGSHIRFIPEPSYVYNIDTPINDFKVKGDEQARIDRMLRKKPAYSPIEHYRPKEPNKPQKLNKQDASPKMVYLTPGLWGELFSISNPYFNRDNCLDVMYQLRDVAAKDGYILRQVDSLNSLEDFEYLIVFDVFPDQIRELRAFPKEKLILFLWEPPSVIPENFDPQYHDLFSKVYTWHDGLVDNQKYFKFYYPVYRPMINDPLDFYFRRFSTLIACNKYSYHPDELYSARLNVIDFYESLNAHDFELYGKRWPEYLKTYQGPIERKMDFLKHYKFAYAYENVKNVPGYVTEKIFDCFQAGVVPIYWGAPNVLQYIPDNCFIPRENFANEAAVYEFLKNMSVTEYAQYFNNIHNFLKSDAARLYSIHHFIEIFMNLLNSDSPKQ